MQTEDLKESSKQTTAEETPQQEAQTNTADAANGVDETAGKKSEGAAEEKTPEQDEKDVKIEELQNRILRLQADFDNFRRRNTSEREQLATFVTADVVGKFLKVLDNFERAEDAAHNLLCRILDSLHTRTTLSVYCISLYFKRKFCYQCS